MMQHLNATMSCNHLDVPHLGSKATIDEYSALANHSGATTDVLKFVPGTLKEPSRHKRHTTCWQVPVR
jgi:hypothetical protein